MTHPSTTLAGSGTRVLVCRSAASTPAGRFAARLAVLAAVVLAGCATPNVNPGAPGGSPRPGSAEPLPSAPGARPGPPPAPALTPVQSEQRYLEDWFRGTPVSISLADVNTLVVDVPLVHSFAPGSTVIKPALAAVLERVATSLRRQPALRVSIAAPADPNAAVALAANRSQQVREHLIGRGVAASRMAGVGTARAGAPTQLRLTMLPQPLGRLDDATLPVPTMGVRPVVAAPASAAKR